MAKLRDLRITNKITDRTPALMQYFDDIKKYPLLTIEEEVGLGYLARVNKDTIAMETLVNSNLRFAVSVAKQYSGKLPLGDLISSANDGLLEAAKRFDETKGFKFISYAVWWIRQSILLNISNNNAIRLPLNAISKLTRVRKFKASFFQENNRYPDEVEIEDELSIFKSSSLEVSSRVTSYDVMINANNDNSTLVTILASNEMNIDSDIDSAHKKKMLEGILLKISKNERTVIRHTFGINDYPILSKSEIGKIIGVGSERVRQLRDAGLKKLKKYAHLFFNN